MKDGASSKGVLREAEEVAGKKTDREGSSLEPVALSVCPHLIPRLLGSDGKSLATGFGILAASGASSCNHRGPA